MIVLMLAAMWLGACQVVTPDAAEPSATPARTDHALPGTATPTAILAKTALTPSPTKTTLPTPTRSVQIPVEKLRGLTITFWHPFSADDALTVESMAARFNQQNTWGFEVQMASYPGFGALEEAFRDAQETGNPPDLLVGYPDQALRWDSGGDGLADLSMYLQDSEWALPPEIEGSYPSEIWAENLLTVDGKNRRIGLPWYRSGFFLAYNQSWAQELGLKAPPETVRILQSQACAASIALKGDGLVENDGRGGWLIANNPGNLVTWMYAFNSSLIAPDSLDYTIDNIQSREAVSTLYQGYLETCFWANETISMVDAFATRQALFVSVSPPELADFSEKLSLAGFEDNWALMALPDLEGKPVVDLYGPAFLIPVTSPERQLAAWAFVRWMSAPDQLADWANRTGLLPASTAPLAGLKTGSSDQPDQWQDALALLPLSRGEPAKASWGSVRWALGEALTRLLSPGLKSGDLQTILTTLDRLAKEIDNQFP